MTFFTKESKAFWDGLAKNNTKEWFDEHRKEYTAHLKEPYYELTEALLEQVAELEPEYDLEPKKAVYRINRDVRFSKDKTPYKTELGITVNVGQKHNWAWPSYTCRVSTKGVWVAGGLYAPEPDFRDHLRLYIGQHAKQLQKLEKKAPFKKTFGQLQGEAHKRTPAELKELVQVEPRVLNKQWVFWADFMDSKLFLDPKLDQFILDQWEKARPVQEFLKDATRAWDPSKDAS